jgi:hypothetical protein
LLEGSGTGTFGIGLATAGYLTVTNTTIRNFSTGLDVGSRNVSLSSIVYVSYTNVSQNLQSGVLIQPATTQLVLVTLSHVEAVANGGDGILINGEFASGGEIETSINDCLANENGWQLQTTTAGIRARGGNSLTSVQRTTAQQNNTNDIRSEHTNSLVNVGGSVAENINGNSIFTWGDNYTGAFLGASQLTKH